jgi:hypothetical protein
MKFNYEKCKYMSFGKIKWSGCEQLHLVDKSKDTIYTLSETKSERDLGVQITCNLKWNDQVTLVTNKAYQILGMLRKTFKFWDLEMTKILYKSYVRPHLEYAVSIWSPYANKDIKRLEMVQRKATKMAFELKNKKYKERLTALSLQSLEERRIRGDAIKMYKITHGTSVVNWYHPVI